MNNNLVELQSMHKELRVEITRDRPAREVAGMTPEVDAQLRDMGIRTVGELSKMNAETLTARTDIEINSANKVIEAANAMLKQ